MRDPTSLEASHLARLSSLSPRVYKRWANQQWDSGEKARVKHKIRDKGERCDYRQCIHPTLTQLKAAHSFDANVRISAYEVHQLRYSSSPSPQTRQQLQLRPVARRRLTQRVQLLDLLLELVLRVPPADLERRGQRALLDGEGVQGDVYPLDGLEAG